MKATVFDQTHYYLPPATLIHVPSEKRPLKKNLYLLQETSNTHSCRMRRVPRRPRYLAWHMHRFNMSTNSVQILPLVSQSPVQTSRCPPRTFVQIPVSQVPQPPVQIYLHRHSPRNLCRFQCHKSSQPPVQIPDVPDLCRCQCHKSHSHLCRFPGPTVTCADSTNPTVTSADSTCATATCADSTYPKTYAVLHVPEHMRRFPQSSTLKLDPLSRRMHSTQLMSFVLDIRPEPSCFTRYPLFSDGDLIAFLDE
ncbi:hypothetical protein TNCV_3744821 [Trichonephila clavipes]|nr:hypothetical protein TNCV_3744821 [Trichonephila clavipes]